MDKLIHSFNEKEYLTLKITDSKEIFQCLYDSSHDFLFLNQTEKQISIKLSEKSVFALCWFYSNANKSKMIFYYELYHNLYGLTISMINDMVNYYKSIKEDINMVKYLLLGVEKNDRNLIFTLATYYKDIKDYPNMIKYFELIKDDKDVAYELGIHYKSIEPEKSLNYFIHSADQFHMNAMYEVGCYYQKKQDFINMFKYFNKASDHGHPASLGALGDHYRVQKDSVNMIKYYLLLEKYGKINSNQLTAMAEHYEKDGKQGSTLEYYQKALNVDKTNLDLIKKMIELNTKDNVKYYIMAADLGSIYHIVELGNHYKKCKDTTKMLKYYELGVKQNHPRAAYELAEYQYTTTRDRSNLLKYYEMALEGSLNYDLTNLYQYCFNNDKQEELLKLYQKYKNKMSSGALIKALDQYLQKVEMKDIPGDIIELICELDLNKFEKVPIYIKTLQIALTKQLDMLKVHFQYAPSGSGYEKAKEHFGKLLDETDK